MKTELIQMGIDLYQAQTKNQMFAKGITANEAEGLFRKELLEITSGKTNVFELDPMQKHNLFNLVQVSVDSIIPTIISSDYDRFTEVRNVALGEKPVFTVSDTSFFKVATVADGVMSVRAQRLDEGQLTVPTKTKAIHIAEDMNRLLAGKIDWATMMTRLAMSFVNDIRKDVYNAIKATYATVPTNFKANGSFDVTKFNTLVQTISAYTFGSPVNVFGSKLALGNVLNNVGYTAYPGLVSQDQMNEFNKKGYLANFMGTDLIELNQSADVNSTDYSLAIDNNYLFFLPTMAEKIVKLVYEGNTIMKENMQGTIGDNTINYTIFKKYGVGVLSPGKWGVYNFAG